MITKIKLHGKLGKIYGESFEFQNINKPMDVVKAMDSILPGFRKHVVNEAKAGGHYEIIINGVSKNVLELETKQKYIKEVEIVPCILGYGPGLGIVLGFLFTGIGFYLGASTALGVFFIALGVGLIIAGIMYLLTPIPENEPNEQNIRSSIRNASFVFQSPTNSVSQGRAIPIVYGRLRVGSHVIGTTINNFELHEDTQLQRRFASSQTNALLKLQKSFGGSISQLYRTY